MQSSRIRRLFLDFFVAQGHREVPSSSLVPGRRPDAPVHQRGHGAVQAHLPRPGAAGLPPCHHVPEVRAGGRQAQRSRTGGPHHAAPHLLRDAGQLLLRRLLQARRDRASPGSSSPAEVPRYCRRAPPGHGPPYRRRGARALARDRGAARPPDLRAGRQGQLLADGRTPARAARAPRSTSTSSGAPATRPPRSRRPSSRSSPRPAASSRSGTSSSCSTTARPTVR